MRARIMTLIIICIVLLIIDYYVFQAVLALTKDWGSVWKQLTGYAFWLPTVASLGALSWWAFGDPYSISQQTRSFLVTGFFALYLAKLFSVTVLLTDDLRRCIQWIAQLFQRGGSGLPGDPISRSEFLAKTALVAAAVPVGAMAYGIISGAHDYRVRRKTIYLPNLPKAFDGIRVGQVSDIHSGSFFNKTAVKGGVEMMLDEKPDVLFFTGDLVNNTTSEVKNYIDVFGKLKAPLGVFSVTGNHDYGDYHQWPTREAKQRNFKELLEAHRIMGFDLLMNEHRYLEEQGEKLAIIGVENWGAGRFAKYGRLDVAHQGTDEAPVKLLLSHDPSHWDAQVRPNYADIDIMFSGHTHGFQFGVEIGNIKWSPSQYAYKQWAGLYQNGAQYLYVNRGFGYIGFPGRVGMPPELTILELKRG